MVVDISKYQGPTCMNQISYEHFGQDRIALKILTPFGMNQMSYGLNILWMFWTGPNVLQGWESFVHAKLCFS